MATFRSVGLEIGTSAVRAAELSIGSVKPSLVAYGEVPLPPKAMVDGEIADKSLISDRLRQLWTEGGFSQNRVNVGVAGLRAIIRDLLVPMVPDKELDGAVAFQAQEVIPFSVDQAITSSRLLQDITGSDGAVQRKVLLAAAHRGLITPVLEVLENAGLTPISIDLSAIAIIRACIQSSPPVAPAEAIVSIGAGLTMVVVHEMGIPTFVRTIGQGGDHVTESIASSLDAPFEDAERTKWNLNLPGPQYMTASAAARDAVVGLINEIRSSVEFYNSQSERQDVGRVILTGGGSMLDGLVGRLQQQIRVPVVTAHPLDGLDTGQIAMLPEDIARREPSMTTVVGLALPETQGVKPINLLPPEVTQKATVVKQRRNVILVCAVVLVLLVVYLGYEIFQVQSVSSNINSDNTQVNIASTKIASLDQINKQSTELASLKSALLPQLQSEVNWVNVLTNLENVKYPNSKIELSSFTFSPGALTTSQPSSGQTTSSTKVLGSVSIGITGFDGYSDYDTWITTIAADKMFVLTTPPTSMTLNPNGSVTFQATLGVTSVAVSNKATYFLQQIGGN